MDGSEVEMAACAITQEVLRPDCRVVVAARGRAHVVPENVWHADSNLAGEGLHVCFVTGCGVGGQDVGGAGVG